MEFLKSLVPMLGTALGGPLGGAAASFIAAKLGLESSTVEAVTEVLNSGKMTPEQIVSVKLAELDFKKFMEDNKIKVVDLEYRDRQGAREMQMATKSVVPAWLTFLITLGFFGILSWMLVDKDVVESPPLLIMLGSLGTAWTGCCAYWFGTTSNSATKTNMIANSTPNGEVSRTATPKA